MDSDTIDGLRRLLAAAQQRIADLTAARDAWQETALAAQAMAVRLQDATDPGPALVQIEHLVLVGEQAKPIEWSVPQNPNTWDVAETRAALPANATARW
jgi:hypothetical protein